MRSTLTVAAVTLDAGGGIAEGVLELAGRIHPRSLAEICTTRHDYLLERRLFVCIMR